MHSSPPPYILLRRQQVEQQTGLKRTAIYEAMSQGNFPKPIKVGASAVRWLENEIQDWVSDKLIRREEARK